ncbi:guanine nucleotide-releasing factor 2 isoform X2 [Eupeodes corollae]|uniref:guanine nucleotide-releasing factor 2 isoform X2 n=1 Tax=Eupeodes corollae TaxID=290404 RepID=UPI0024910E3B|nr:guanine nucleotide-releasing factor 2 isoform X2 [Eupeodes corollae]
MPEFDESFLIHCAQIEKHKPYSYSLDRRYLKKKSKPRVLIKNVIRYNNVSSPSTPNSSTIGSSGHKNSLKGTKLARRAKSFKDDLFEKISLMRTPTNTLGRPHSPHSPRSKHSKPSSNEDGVRSLQSLETHVKDIQNALKHFRDVISKKKLEVLPGNGTVILEMIASMYAVIQTYTLKENSNVMLSATRQMYLSLGKLIKLCDEVLLCEEANECTSLTKENVKEVVDLVDEAVKNLVGLAQQKLKEKEEINLKYAATSSENKISPNNLMRPPVEMVGQRTSLPDIPLTPKDRDILEKANSNPIRATHSTESILRDSSPPPKPPLPNRSIGAPPLPPKRRGQQIQNNTSSINSELDFSSDFSMLNYGVDHLSVRSRSPDENSSQCSLDSALNHSREEEELKALTMETSSEDQFLEDDPDKLLALKSPQNKKDSEKLVNAVMEKPEMRKTNRHSNESGFVSMQSIRTSTQSVSKRSSEYSVQHKSAGQFTTESNQELISSHHHKAFGRFSSTSLSVTTNNQATFSGLETQNGVMSFTKTSSGTNDDNQSISNSSASPDHFESSMKSEKIINVQQSMSSLTKTNSLDISSSDDMFSTSLSDLVPPALPPKISKIKEKHFSQYDNLDEIDDIHSMFGAQHNDLPELRSNPLYFQWQSKHQSLIDPRQHNFSMEPSIEEPPPLPMKKKHMFQSVAFSVLAYMEICSATSRSVEQHRHSMHTYNINRNISHSQTMNLSPVSKPLTSQSSLTSSPINEIPPALPPKNKQRIRSTPTPTIITTPPQSPKPAMALELFQEGGRIGRVITSAAGTEMSTVNEEGIDEEFHSASSDLNPMSDDNACEQQENNKDSPVSNLDNTNEEDEGIDVILRNNSYNKKDCSPTNSVNNEGLPNLIEELDISAYMNFKKDIEDGPEVKGGYLDALIVHACRVQKNSDNAFCEAFITTFRTFIQPLELIEKLTRRYSVLFCQMNNDQKQRAAKETFSLLVRVVNDLTSTDLVKQLLELLIEFVNQLVCSGELYMAKLLRNKVVEKVMTYREQKLYSSYLSEQRCITANQPTLLDLKSLEIAEQMTLLDAELFQKIEIPEVLLFAKEQCEEKSPNLNKFTEHFNKMSYWARSKILMQPDAKDREKHVIKFIKIMKHLRKMNNYNSYLALLSALDSAPIRRLEWHKTITEGLKEYCALIDSSSSFRIYRQALAETNPPCIPYIGLVLQDLTFVHVGNPDYLKDGVINFSKRWQQHNIIVNMKRFKKCAYPFKRNERIIRFFENFEDFLGEEQMWQISENIKPRGRRAPQN